GGPLLPPPPPAAPATPDAPSGVPASTAGDAIDAKYRETGGPSGPLGPPAADGMDLPKQAGRFRMYGHGVIVWTRQLGAQAIGLADLVKAAGGLPAPQPGAPPAAGGTAPAIPPN